MKIRKATKKDILGLVKLDREANKEIKWWTPLSSSEFSKLIKKKLVYVAEDRKIIGYLNGDIKEKQLIFENIYVKKEFRDRGIAKRLIKRFLSDLKKFKEIRLDCPERLKKFYEKFGFKTTALIMKRRKIKK